MIGVGLGFLIALAALAPSSAEAQRRPRREPPPPLAELSLEPMEEAPTEYHRVLQIRALEPIELVADRRLLRLEVLPEGERRPWRCEHPDRPRRAPADRMRRLQPGEIWSEWLDLRELCWGRSLEALRRGGVLTITFGPRERGRGRFAALRGSEERREIGPITQIQPLIPEPAEPDDAAPVRVILSPTDALTGRSFTLRVAVLGRAGATRRAYVRPDRIRFEGVGPEGPISCAIRRGGGAPQPDLFQRLTARGGPRFALDGAMYCRDALRASAGIYELVPIVRLEEDGAAYRLDAITGEFRGAPALVRIRRGDRGYVEHPVEGAP